MFYGGVAAGDDGEGDRLFVASAGAYTLSYASHFNGFPPPPDPLPPVASARGRPRRTAVGC